VILQNLFRAVTADAETSPEAQSDDNMPRTMQVLSADDLREVAGGPVIRNGSTSAPE